MSIQREESRKLILELEDPEELDLDNPQLPDLPEDEEEGFELEDLEELDLDNPQLPDLPEDDDEEDLDLDLENQELLPLLPPLLLLLLLLLPPPLHPPVTKAKSPILQLCLLFTIFARLILISI